MSALHAEIILFVETNNWSYQLVADRFGVTRNVVAGVMFRHRHPYETLVDSKGSRGSRNKTGKGWRPSTYYPAYTAKNSVAR